MSVSELGSRLVCSLVCGLEYALVSVSESRSASMLELVSMLVSELGSQLVCSLVCGLEYASVYASESPSA